jgi:O-succinylbenzoic acid--CoA ligase
MLIKDNKIDLNIIVENHANNPALIWPGGELTYLQYFRQIDQISEILLQKGMQRGDIIAILSDVNHHFPILLFAIIKLGGIVLPLNPKLPGQRIREIFSKFKSDGLIRVGTSTSFDPDDNIKVYDDANEDEMAISENDLKSKFVVSLNQPATIILTSGSGGEQKGVLHSVGNHYYSALGSNEIIPLSLSDCWMVSLPFFHIAGIAILFRTMLSGAACYIPDQYKKIQEQLHYTRVSHLSLVSTQLFRWLHEPGFSKSYYSLRSVLVGGSQIPDTLIEGAAQKKIPIYVSYGSTEMSSQIATAGIEDLQLNRRSSGKILSYRQLKIDQNGEVLVRGETLGHGYVDRKKVIPFTDNEGWFHTGDIGYLDENQNLIVTGRKDNMFISGGENIHPEEIERFLLFEKNILDVCVVNVPDVEYGAIPVAFVKMESGIKIDEVNLKDFLRDKIAAFKIPKRFLPWPENLDGIKPNRRYLQKLALKLFPGGE